MNVLLDEVLHNYITHIFMQKNLSLRICYEMFLIIQLHLTCRKDCMQSPIKEEIMKLQVYDAVANVQKENDKEQVAEGSCKAQVCSYKGTCGKCVD